MGGAEDVMIHSGWATPLRVEVLPDLVTVQELDDFRERLTFLTPNERNVIRARAVGQSIPEIAAAHRIAEHTVKNLTTRALDRLGVRASNVFARVPRAAYLLGRIDGE